MEAEKQQIAASHLEQRPMVLSLLCVVSFVYNGLVILLLLAAFVFRDYLIEVIAKYSDPEAPVLSFYSFVLAGLILAGLAFLGVLKMWQLKKTGFYLFLLSNILLMLLLYAFFTLSLWHLISSILLLFLFWIYAKRMK